MALQLTTSTGLEDTMKVFYDRVLLERTLPILIYDKFAQRKRIPMHGGLVVEFRKFLGLATATTPLTEAEPPSLKDLTMTAQTATVAQYGDAVGFSDLVSTTTFDPILTETTTVLAEQAAETIDEIIRASVVAGTTVYHANGAAAINTAFNTISVLDLRNVVRILTLNRAKKIDGYWNCIIHPNILFDLQSTDEWKEANQFAGSQRIFDGSIGILYGIKFWETDKAHVAEGAGFGSADVYNTMFFGANAYGVVDLDGHSLQTIYKGLGSAGTADPLNQQQSMGWKVTFGVTRLVEAWMLRYTCNFSADN